jgi:hypothetical protein
MIHEAINALIADIKLSFPAVKECRYYKGEFEPEGEWNPIFPAVLINCSSLLPGIEAQASWQSGKIKLNVYVAIKLDIVADQTFFKNFTTYITSLVLGEYQFKALGAFLVGYFSGVEVYRFELETEQKF